MTPDERAAKLIRVLDSAGETFFNKDYVQEMMACGIAEAVSEANKAVSQSNEIPGDIGLAITKFAVGEAAFTITPGVVPRSWTIGFAAALRDSA